MTNKVCNLIFGFFLIIPLVRSQDVVYHKIKATNESGNLNMVIEIPAGTNHKVEYDYNSNTFPVEIVNGKERVVNYLPYPGNYGFIPSTLMDTSRGGDGDALDVLVIAESVPTGTVMEVNPVAILKLKDRGEWDDKIIAVPTDSLLQIVKLKNDLPSEEVLESIKSWFVNYKGPGKMEFLGWVTGQSVYDEIDKWRK